MKENVIVSFSGGRTSGYMSWWLKKYMSHLYNFVFVYANTGLEHEKTLEFVDKCDKEFDLDLVWLEAVFDPRPNKGTTYKFVDFNSATRNGDLFMEMCSIYGLPNQTYIHCTRELKLQPIIKWGKDNFDYFRTAVGLRSDEPARLNKVKYKAEIFYPFASIVPMTKQDVLDWWKLQPFDLDIEEHYGNCVGCYKKSDTKLKMIADENPHYFDPFVEMENKYTSVRAKKEEYDRIIYRQFRTAYEVKNNINLPEKLSELDECAEECGSIFSDYVPERAEARLF